MHGLFFVGTDTGVGKTYVLAAVVRALRRREQALRVCKPVATGAEQVAGRWLGEDTRLLAEAAGDLDYDAITPWRFPVPAAPPVAARLAGACLSLAEIVRAVRRRTTAGHMLLVEGVGGLLCPLTERETVADLAAELGLPLVVVVRRSLGTLNHTLLTLEAARARQLPVAGVVVNETEPVRGIADETNVEELRRRIAVPLLAVVPHLPPPVNEDVSALAQIDWPGLTMLRGSVESEPGSAPKETTACRP